MLAGDDRLATYFVVVGLGDNPTLYEEVSDDAVKSKLKPITDIVVINVDEGEEPPPGYVMIEQTPSKLDADLNHGSFRAPRMHLCYKRGTHKPPLTEIGVLFDGKEQPMDGCTVLEHTPYGRSANVNNSAKDRTFLVYRRAATLSASELYAVTEIDVLNKSKGDRAPHRFLEITKPLNRGMIGSEMVLCYRKAPVRWNTIAYRPSIISRFPLTDYVDQPLPPSVPLFCLPLGCTIEAWPRNYTAPASPAFSSFVLTSDVRSQLYGASIDFYEPYDSRVLTEEQRLHLGLDLRVADLDVSSGGSKGTGADAGSDATPTDDAEMAQHQKPLDADSSENYRLMRTVCRKSIGVLSAYPCFDAFRDFLRFLHKVVTSGSRVRHALKIERYVTFFINNVLLPAAAKRRILLQLSPVDCVRIELPFERPIEAGGASFRRFLLHLGAENCIELFALALTEQKLLIHSLMRNEVTPVCEAIRAMTFPLSWQCVYIPLCPPGIAHEITAGSSFDDFLGMPNPFIVGVDSRSFDFFTPPDDVICVDIDTRAILRSGEKRSLTAAKLLPKRVVKQLRSTLDELFHQMLADDDRERSRAAARRATSLDPLAADEEIARRRRREFGVELLIQQAFVRSMCSILRGYKQFFKPIVRAPTLDTACDLFDTDAFIRSREKHDARFYQLLTHTQMFSRFVEECSFTTNAVLRSALAFFDECATRADVLDSSGGSAASNAFNAASKLLHASSNVSLNTATKQTLTSSSTSTAIGSLTHVGKSAGAGDLTLPRRDSVHQDDQPFALFALDLRADPSETTVFLSVPEPDPDAAPVTYNGFPALDVAELRADERRAPRVGPAGSLHPQQPHATGNDDTSLADARLLVIREKQELRHSQRHAEDAFKFNADDNNADDDTRTAEEEDDRLEQQNAKARIKCVQYHCYAVWFVHLPAYASMIQDAAGRRRLLRLAYETLVAFHERNRFVVADQVCHRVLMLLCGRYQEPRLAVRILERMRRHIEPNAITYACYNRTLFECRWDVESQAAASWRRMRHVIVAAACFRAPLKRTKEQTAANATSPQPQLHLEQSTPTGARNFDHRRSASITGALAPVNASETASNASLSVGSLEVLPHRVAISSSDSLPTESSAEKHSANFSLQHADANANQLLLGGEIGGNAESRPESTDQEPETPKADGAMDADETPRSEALLRNPFELLGEAHRKNESQALGGAGMVQRRAEARRNRLSLQFGGTTGRRYSSGVQNSARSPGHATKQPKAGTPNRILQLAAGPSSKKDRLSVLRSAHGMLLVDANAAGILMTTYNEQDASVDRVASKFGQTDWLGERRSGSAAWRPCEQPHVDSGVDSRADASKDSGLQHVGPSNTELRMLLETSGGLPISSDVSSVSDLNNVSKQDSQPQADAQEVRGRKPPKLSMLQERSDLHRSYLEGQRPPRPPPPDFSKYRSATMPVTESPPGVAAGQTDADGDSVSSQQAAARRGSIKSTESALSDAMDSDGNPANLPKWATSLKQRLNTNTQSYKSKFSNSSLLSAVRFAFQNSNSPLHTLKSNAVAYLQYAAGATGEAAAVTALAAANPGPAPTQPEARRPSESGAANNATMERKRAPNGPNDARSANEELEPVSVRSYYTADSGYVDDASIAHFLPTTSPSTERSSHKFTTGRIDETRVTPPKRHGESNSQRASGTSKRVGTRRSVLVEVDMCNVSRCETCQLLLYDEEIMSGWLPDDSNLRTICQFCETPTVPRLQVIIRDRRAVVAQQLRSSMQSRDTTAEAPAQQRPPSDQEATTTQSSEQQQPNASDSQGQAAETDEKPQLRRVVAQVRQLEPISVPFLSSLVLRKELETLIASESEMALARPSFADKHPILYWNLVYNFKRLMLPTHLPGFVLYLRVLTGGQTNSQLFTASGSSNRDSYTGRDRDLDRDTVEPRLLYSAAQYVHVRLLWDNPHALLVDDAYRPFYHVLKRRRSLSLSPPVADAVFERAEAMATSIRNALMQERENVKGCIELLIRERERVNQEVQQAIAAATANDQEPAAGSPEAAERDRLLAAAAGISYTLTKRSIYREILFLLIADLGSNRIDVDAYDVKYTTAFNKLSAADKNRLLPNDAPPLTINRLFRRAFCPQPLELV